jgi:hypothetical protein
MAFWTAAAAIASGVMGAFGSGSEASARNEAVERQFDQQMDEWRFGKKENRKDYNHAKKGVKIQRENIEQEYAYRDATAQQDYRFQLAIADIQDRTNQAAYAKSLETYGLQRGFNNMAAANAYAAEQRKIQEAVTEMSFQNQDVTIQSLQEAGNIQASGAAGRSAGKALHAVLAQAGRNQAILAESLVSANANLRQANNKIASDKFGADLNAWSNVMVKPIASARPETPLSMPRPKLQMPRKPGVAPKPTKGATSSPFAAGVSQGFASLPNIVSAMS